MCTTVELSLDLIYNVVEHRRSGQFFGSERLCARSEAAQITAEDFTLPDPVKDL